MKYIDIHCHLDFPDYDFDRGEILTEMKKQGIGAITIGTDLESSKKAVELAEANENIWACIGIHPEIFLEEKSENNIEGTLLELENLIKNPKVVGIGECGLEYFVMKKAETGKRQKELFEAQIKLALKYDKPLMLHIRSSSKNNFDAYEEALEILGNYKKDFGEKLRGNVHFFAADTFIAQKFLDFGFSMSFTGVVTFLPSRSSAQVGTHDYDEVVKYLPLDSIMSETDAPFVAPVPFRGQRNSPVYVSEIVKKMAEIKGETIEKMSAIILENARRLFGIPS